MARFTKSLQPPTFAPPPSRTSSLSTRSFSSPSTNFYVDAASRWCMVVNYSRPVHTATPNDLCCVVFAFSLLPLHVYLCVDRHISFRSKNPVSYISRHSGRIAARSFLTNILTNINPSRWKLHFCFVPILAHVLSAYPLAPERAGPPFSDYTACFVSPSSLSCCTKPGY